MDGSGADDITAAFDFGTFVKYNRGAWQRLHQATPEAMSVGDLNDNGQDDVIASFGSTLGGV